jgi:PleD family two-component response regulator
MVEMVLRQSGFRVSSASTVANALERASALKPDIITTSASAAARLMAVS